MLYSLEPTQLVMAISIYIGGYIDGRLLCVPPLKSRRMNETLDERRRRRRRRELGGRASRKTTDKNMAVKEEEEEWEAKERNDTNTHGEKEK